MLTFHLTCLFPLLDPRKQPESKSPLKGKSQKVENTSLYSRNPMGGIIASILKAPPFSLRNCPADEHSTYAGYAFRLETLAGCFGP